MSTTNYLTKSCNLEKTPEIVAFVKAQKNFSKSIYLLIMKFIMSNDGKVLDIYSEYMKHLEREFLNGYPSLATDDKLQSNTVPVSESITDTSKAVVATSSQKPKNDTNMEIPEEYI